MHLIDYGVNILYLLVEMGNFINECWEKQISISFCFIKYYLYAVIAGDTSPLQLM